MQGKTQQALAAQNSLTKHSNGKLNGREKVAQTPEMTAALREFFDANAQGLDLEWSQGLKSAYGQLDPGHDLNISSVTLLVSSDF